MTLTDVWRKGKKLVKYGRNALIEHSVIHNAIEFSKKSSMSLGKLLLLPPEPKTVFRGECGIPKRAVWSDPIPLKEIKEIGGSYDATINDVLLSALTGALHSYIEEHGDSVEGLNIRAIIPVDLRRPETLQQMGNLFGLVFLSLPVGIRNPLDRQVVLKQRMDTIKDTPEALVALGLLSAIGLTPQKMEKALIDIFSSKATVAVTNVPGPRQPLYLGRSRINGLMFWVPTPANLSLGISIISYSGQVLIGVMADSGIIPDPEKIVSLFHDELTYMKEWEQSTQEQRSGPKSKSEEIGDHVHGGSPQDTISQVIPDRCLAQTKTGEQCKNRALLDSDYCHVHQKKDTQ
jgi:WS/DGAT/MGAT family acyltransferase